MATIQKWLGKAFDGKDHTVEVAEVAFLLVVLAGIFWLGHGIYKGKGFTEGWNNAFLTLSGLVCLSKGNSAWANRGPKPLDPGTGGTV